MNIFSERNYRQFSDIDLAELNKCNFSVYILDHSWNYLFVNDFVAKNLGARGHELIGKNIWKEFPELSVDPAFVTLRNNSERRQNSNIMTTSPLTLQRLSITGLVLNDCTLFTSTILPKKEELLNELRISLDKNNIRQ